LGAAVLIAFLAAVISLRRTLGIEQYFTGDNLNPTITTMRAWAVRFGFWGPALFSLAGAVALLLMIPAFLIICLAVLLFGYLVGGIVSALALVGGTTLIYFIGQVLGRPFLQGLFGTRLISMEERFLRRELMNVIYYRLIFFLNPLMNWLLCVSGVRLRNLMLGTLLGSAHGIILIVWFGGLIVELIQSGRSLNPVKSPQLLIPLVIGVAIFGVIRIADAWYQRRRVSRST
jgi:uncharacterized membrane protein YdjX (TVP38/TMEM64 family)